MKRRTFLHAAGSTMALAGFLRERAFAENAIPAELAARRLDGTATTLRAADLEDLRASLARSARVARRCAIRHLATHLERRLRPPPRPHRALRGRRRHRVRPAVRGRAPIADRGARRRAFAVGTIDVRRRPRDRSLADEERAYRSAPRVRAYRAGCVARRAGPGSAGVRPGHDHGHGFAHRRRGTHAGRRRRTSRAPVRTRDRQPAGHRHRDARRQAACGEFP